MSRIGKQPIAIPSGVTVDIQKSLLKVKGPKGELERRIDPALTVKVEDNQIVIDRPTDQKRHRAMHGLYRQLVNNMVIGVTEGYEKKMEIVGVGYKVSNTGSKLELSLGYSHPIVWVLPPEISVETETKRGENPSITLKCIDKQLLGEVAAKIRRLRPPEPYKGKGIRFKGEHIRRKAGKAGGK